MACIFYILKSFRFHHLNWFWLFNFKKRSYWEMFKYLNNILEFSFHLKPLCSMLMSESHKALTAVKEDSIFIWIQESRSSMKFLYWESISIFTQFTGMAEEHFDTSIIAKNNSWKMLCNFNWYFTYVTTVFVAFLSYFFM